jgi:hypothetical protein
MTSNTLRESTTAQSIAELFFGQALPAAALAEPLPTLRGRRRGVRALAHP